MGSKVPYQCSVFTSFNMSLKLFRIHVLKNELFYKILATSSRSRFFTNRLCFDKTIFEYQTKFCIQQDRIINHSYLNKNLSTLNNQSEIDFEQTCNETLESLCEYFEIIVEESPQLDNPDITFSDGVLTIQLGKPYGTYVINRQTPNKQIWLSSPKSGPKRYDFDGTKWIYKHDGISLHELLTTELSDIFSDVNFSECVFSGTK